MRLFHGRRNIGISASLIFALMLLGPLAAPVFAAPFDPSTFSVKLTEIASGLSQPLEVVDPDDGSGRLFIVEKTGTVRILKDGKVSDTPFLDISDHVSNGSEQGLLSLAFDPKFKKTGALYIDYTNSDGNTRVERWHVAKDNPDQADPNSAFQILAVDQPYPNHNGGLLMFGPDGNLYIGLGDGGSQGDPNGNGQNLNTLLGKILRIHVDPANSDSDHPYTVPKNNPFVDKQDARPEIWAYGLRNPWRFSFDRKTGDLYIADVGQSTYEEIDVQPANSQGGQNYGWNIMEGVSCYATSPCDQSGLTLPVFTYTHDSGCSVTGGFVYRGKAYSSLDGIYLFADYCSGLLWGLGNNADGAWVASAPVDTGLSVSSFGEDANGELYVADLNGGVYKVSAGS
ncbi:MAG TPA: PQQ-dependent sugar dehydrogenase [Thermomicrobiales bacterium]|nr:PQQ-dependent sugar dehydrogenase [Thermomicrobiales bacterium]